MKADTGKALLFGQGCLLCAFLPNQRFIAGSVFCHPNRKFKIERKITAMTNIPASSQSYSVSDQKIMNKIHQITDQGYNAEVKKTKDGGLKVYEVKKKIR